MSMSADIRQALVDHPIGMTRDELFGACEGGEDGRKFGALLSALKGSGKIKVGGERGGESYFLIASWPEKSLKPNGAEPVQLRVSAADFAKQREPEAPKVKLAKRTEQEELGAQPEIPPAPAAPVVDDPLDVAFALSEQGELGIERDGKKILVSNAALRRMQGFLERTEEVWKR